MSDKIQIARYKFNIYDYRNLLWFNQLHTIARRLKIKHYAYGFTVLTSIFIVA